MAQAVRVMTVERGIDPRDMALVAFGGAGPLHAAQIAAELGMRRVIAPIASGVLSALGLVVSERRRDVVESVLLGGDALTREAVGEAVRRLGEQARGGLDERPRSGLGDQTAGPGEPELRATYDLRYAGQAFELSIDGPLSPEPAELRAAFDRAHEERYGYADPEAELELVTVRVAAALPGAEPPPARPAAAEERGSRTARFGDERVEARVLGPGEVEVDGPAIFELPGATLVVPPGWQARSGPDVVVMER
jgi:N-methylhydantoinase A/oxoprolinase/acetone carboxylase beta subunit